MNNIPDIANLYIGQKEIPGNKGFLNKTFENKIKAQDWYVGAPWCCFFAKLVWEEGDQDVSCMNGSAVKSYTNLVEKGFHKDIVPVEGALVFWRSYKNGLKKSTGHVGIVTRIISETEFESVEGNTTEKGGREGLVVAKRTHTFDWNKQNGLRLLGFIYPK